ncbi:MAG: sigma-70 family RNA polymerase sigma factor [Oscillospiraceae bacterium]|nr:sigma-70 family RNA polymerase sigma factor [Oscillospiraceae bacterium]
MIKETADKCILSYQKKIFGFALAKMRNIAQAEELAADIACEVYVSFLQQDEILNLDGYVYRIAQNVFAKHIRRQNTTANMSLFECPLPCFDDTQQKLEQNEAVKRLRAEIALLSRRQRSVVFLHYYENKTTAEIAKLLQVSPGTVKWHLSDARERLKDGLTMNNTTQNLAVNPIKFISMGHNGSPGINGDTASIFDTRLKQNIAYCCYYNAMTVEEIARTLSLPAVFVADELKVLEEYAYLDRTDNSRRPKFRTNMLLTDLRAEPEPGLTEADKLHKAAAKTLCDVFYPKVFDDFDASANNWGLFCGDGQNDKNYMKYSLVMLCTRFLFDTDGCNWWRQYAVKRPDGGQFIAHACVVDDCTQNGDIRSPYWVCGYMHRTEQNRFASLQLDCHFASREGRWIDNLNADWAALYRFLKQDDKKQALPAEDYKRLCDKGYLLDEQVQVVTCKTKKRNKLDWLHELINKNIHVPQSIFALGKELDANRFRLEKDRHPPHMRPLVRHYNSDSLSSSAMVPHVVEAMLERGMLQPLTERQKKSVFTIMVY